MQCKLAQTTEVFIGVANRAVVTSSKLIVS